MTYTKQTWENAPSTDTPVSAARLGHMEDGIAAANDQVALKADAASLAEVATSGAYTDLSGLPDLKPVATSGAYTDLTGTPALKPVATTGKYTSLTDIPDGLVRVMGTWDAVSNAPVLANNQVDPVQSSVGFTGLASALGVAVDADGTVYVADNTNKQVYKRTSAGVQSPVGFTGLAAPYGVAVDADGTVYVADNTNKQVYKRTSAGVQSSVGFTGLMGSSHQYVAVDADGTVYVADNTNKQVYKRTSAGVQSPVGFTGLAAALGVAVDADGTVYVADSMNKQVYGLRPGGDSIKGHMYHNTNTTAASVNLGAGAQTIPAGAWILHDGTQWATV